MRINLRGFIVSDHIADFDHARRELVQLHRDGKLKVQATIVEGGMGVLDKALADLAKGVNTGRSHGGVRRCVCANGA